MTHSPKSPLKGRAQHDDQQTSGEMAGKDDSAGEGEAAAAEEEADAAASKGLDEEKIIQSISPIKDVDGLSNENLGLLASGNPRFVPATPLGVQVLLHEINAKTEGSNIVIIGRSKLVGIPLALLLSSKSDLGNASVTICHSKSKNIKSHTIKADIVVVATGFPHTLTADMVRKDSVVIDVGVNRIEDKSKKNGYRLIGDCDFEEIYEIASKITPVPGGVGPMTIACLLKNTLECFKARLL